MNTSQRLLTSLAIGVPFGFALGKGQVFVPKTIIRQLLLEDHTMVKMFVSAAATSLLMIALLHKSKHTNLVEKIRFADLADRGIFVSVLGGSILGTGMALSGSCPGTVSMQFVNSNAQVFVQLGSGVSLALFTLLGGLTGALIFGFTEPVFRTKFPKWKLPNTKFTLDKYFSLPFISIALPLGLALYTFAGTNFLAFQYSSLSNTRIWVPFRYRHV